MPLIISSCSLKFKDAICSVYNTQTKTVDRLYGVTYEWKIQISWDYLIFNFVQLHSSCMSKKHVVCCNIWLCPRIPSTAIELLPRWTPAWWKRPSCITRKCICQGLIKSDPMLHPVSKFLITKFCILPKVVPICWHFIKDTNILS